MCIRDSPSFEHDNCGIGAIVNIKGTKTHQTVEDALKIVENLELRAGKDLSLIHICGLKRGCNTDLCRCRFAVMNPELTYTPPDYQTQCGCTDIMMHTMERYFNMSENMELTDGISEAPVSYTHLKQVVKAVDDVSFQIHKGETYGLVGESGCGKSTLGRTIVKINEPTDGKILVNGEDITHLSGQKLKKFRKNIQLIFQDPYASLNPRMTVGEIIREPMVIHHIYQTRKEQDDRVAELLKIVGLKPDHVRRYPHDFSGGQRQRI